jgi:hypothetical protein
MLGNKGLLNFSEADVSGLRSLAGQSVKFSKMADDEYFSKPENVYKLSYVLGLSCDIGQLFKIWENLSETSIVRDAVEFEIRLALGPENFIQNIPYVAEKVSKFTDFLTGNENFTVSLHIVDDTEFLIAIRLMIYAGLKGKNTLVEHILNSFRSDHLYIAVEFAGSLGMFCGKYLKRLRPTAPFKPWIDLCNTLDALSCHKCPKALRNIRLANALLLSGNGDFVNSLKLAKSASGDNKRFITVLEMSKHLAKGDFEGANTFADQLILLTSAKSTDDSIPFNRDTAEKSLRAVNDVLLKAGIKAFIISGTLLGCVRDGRIFEHDKDFDLGVIGWESQFDIADALLKTGRFGFYWT